MRAAKRRVAIERSAGQLDSTVPMHIYATPYLADTLRLPPLTQRFALPPAAPLSPTDPHGRVHASQAAHRHPLRRARLAHFHPASCLPQASSREFTESGNNTEPRWACRCRVSARGHGSGLGHAMHPAGCTAPTHKPTDTHI